MRWKKEIAARTPSVEAFIRELKQAVAEGGLTIGIRKTDPLRTKRCIHPASSTGERPRKTSGASFDSMAGTVSSSQLSAEDQAKLAASRAAREQEQRERSELRRKN